MNEINEINRLVYFFLLSLSPARSVSQVILVYKLLDFIYHVTSSSPGDHLIRFAQRDQGKQREREQKISPKRFHVHEGQKKVGERRKKKEN